LRHRRLDDAHSNLVRAWTELGGGADWPAGGQWDELAAHDRLEDLEPPHDVSTAAGAIDLDIDLPMPAISLIELEPA
jgi:xylan 1,4-beta-xylosidase